MKKIISLILTLTLVLGTCLALGSCGGKKNQIKVNPDKEKYTVGIIQLAPHEALDAATQGFKDALTEALAKEGREVEFKYQNAQGDSNTCNTIVNSFVSEDVDLIMANATNALYAAYSATEYIPILGTSITEYGVALGIDNFSGVVGGNTSGTSDLAPLDTQAQMMIDILGLEEGATIGLLYCSAEPNSQYQVNKVSEYLTSKGMTCKEYKFTESNELSAITRGAASEVDAIYVPTDNTIATNTSIINNVCEELSTPVFAGEEATCSGCGFATLSISYYNIGKKTGEMAARILLGKESISEMEVQYDAEPVKKYNKAICERLGIDTAMLEEQGYVMIEGTEN